MGDIKVPKALLPENIMDTVKMKVYEEKRRRKRKKIKIAAWSVVSAAATIAIICGVYFNFINTNYESKYDNVEGLYTVGSYKALYNYANIKELMVSIKGTQSVSKNSVTDGAFGSDTEGESGKTEHTETNVQTEGIDEGDIVKTDGTYIYAAGEEKIVTLKADGKNTKKVSEINIFDEIRKNESLEEENVDVEILEQYISGDRVVVIADVICSYEDDRDIKHFTYVLTINSNDGKLSGVKMMKQDGDYKTSRLKDGIVYVISKKGVYESKERKNIIPHVNDEEIPGTDVFFTGTNGISSYYCQYNIITSVDIYETDVEDTKVYMGSNIAFYMSENYMYFASEGQFEKTDIVKFAFGDGNITPIAVAHIKGDINNQFSMDEYKGYLRVAVTTVRDNGLFILDEKMNVISSLKGMAEGESIKSARFFGDIGYIVTYRQTDPLFSLDLSDPYNPKITGELKIPGFSTYLHVIDKNTLLGIGYLTDETGFSTNGIKMTLFDASDKSDVRVKSNIEYKNADSAEALHNHKAVLASDNKGLYGFSMNIEVYDKVGEDEYVYSGNKYVYKVYKYSDGEIKEVESIVCGERGYGENQYRGMYIGEYFYLAGRKNVCVYNLEDIVGENEAEMIFEVYY